MALTPTMTTVSKAKRGDIVRFKSYSLRVESDPVVRGNRIVLSGRISTDGCPTVTRSFMLDLACTIEAGQ